MLVVYVGIQKVRKQKQEIIILILIKAEESGGKGTKMKMVTKRHFFKINNL